MSTIARWILSWVVKNGTLKIYKSLEPVGKRLGGHDLAQIPDAYLILDIRCATRILLFGYFQFS